MPYDRIASETMRSHLGSIVKGAEIIERRPLRNSSWVKEFLWPPGRPGPSRGRTAPGVSRAENEKSAICFPVTCWPHGRRPCDDRPGDVSMGAVGPNHFRWPRFPLASTAPSDYPIGKITNSDPGPRCRRDRRSIKCEAVMLQYCPLSCRSVDDDKASDSARKWKFYELFFVDNSVA